MFGALFRRRQRHGRRRAGREAEPGNEQWNGRASEFRTGNDFRFFGSLYGTNTTVIFGDNAVIHGSIIGRRISGATLPMWEGQPCCNQKAPTLHFDRAMATRPICTYSRFGIRRGRGTRSCRNAFAAAPVWPIRLAAVADGGDPSR